MIILLAPLLNALWLSALINRILKLLFTLLIALVVSAIILIIFYNMVWLGTENRDTKIKVLLLNVVGVLNYSAMRVLGVFCVFGFAHYYLNTPSKLLTDFNDAVYPFYILHQTFIIVIVYQLTNLALGPIVEPALLILLTTISYFIALEIIKRIDLLKPCFDLASTKV